MAGTQAQTHSRGRHLSTENDTRCRGWWVTPFSQPITQPFRGWYWPNEVWLGSVPPPTTPVSEVLPLEQSFPAQAEVSAPNDHEDQLAKLQRLFGGVSLSSLARPATHSTLPSDTSQVAFAQNSSVPPGFGVPPGFSAPPSLIQPTYSAPSAYTPINVHYGGSVPTNTYDHATFAALWALMQTNNQAQQYSMSYNDAFSSPTVGLNGYYTPFVTTEQTNTVSSLPNNGTYVQPTLPPRSTPGHMNLGEMTEQTYTTQSSAQAAPAVHSGLNGTSQTHTTSDDAHVVRENRTTMTQPAPASPTVVSVKRVQSPGRPQRPPEKQVSSPKPTAKSKVNTMWSQSPAAAKPTRPKKQQQKDVLQLSDKETWPSASSMVEDVSVSDMAFANHTNTTTGYNEVAKPRQANNPTLPAADPDLLAFMAKCFPDTDKELITDVLMQCNNDAVTAMEALLPPPDDFVGSDDHASEQYSPVGAEAVSSNGTDSFATEPAALEPSGPDGLVSLCEMFPDTSVERLEAALERAKGVLDEAINMVLAGDLPPPLPKTQPRKATVPPAPKIALRPIGKGAEKWMNSRPTEDLVEQMASLRDIFPGYTEDDLFAALAACDYDKEAAVASILMVKEDARDRKHPTQHKISLNELQHMQDPSAWEGGSMHLGGLARQLKCQRLQEMYRHVDPIFIEEIFAANSYDFFATQQDLKPYGQPSPTPSKHQPASPRSKLQQKTPTKQPPADGRPKPSLVGSIGVDRQAKEQKDDGGFQQVAKKKRPLPKVPGNYAVTQDQMYREERSTAVSLAEQRNECFRKAAAAYQAKNVPTAQHYSAEGHRLNQLLKEEQMEAARRILSQRNTGNNILETVDLHGLHVNEAVTVLKEILRKHQDGEANGKCETLRVITGSGIHSADGKARIKASILAMLRARKVRFESVSNGVIDVSLKNLAGF